MSAFKNLLKSDTPTSGSSKSTGLGGQGSHFPKDDNNTSALSSGPTTVTGTEPRAAEPSSQAATTAGPETTGQSHVGTASTASTNQPSTGLSAMDTSEHSTAAEDTSTSQATSSVAAAAASQAWATHGGGEKMPGEYPSAGYENPYKATHALDPRVDGGNAGDAPAPHTSTEPSTTTATTEPVPSTLATTADPADRSAVYSGSVENKGLDAADTSAPAAAETESGQEQQGIAGRVLGGLGIGSAAAAAAGYLGYGKKSESTDEPHDTSAIATQPGQPSQETGPPKHYRRESIPTTAYPAGPSSPRPVAPPIGGTQPLSSQDDLKPSEGVTTQPAQTVHDQTTTTSGTESHTGRDVAAAGAATAAVGTGAYAVHEHDKQETPTTAATTADTATPTQTDAGTTTALPDRTKEPPIDAVAAAPGRLESQDAKPTASSALAQEPEKEEDHTARNTALGAGAGAAVVGGAAYAAHERSDEDAARAAAEQQKELAKQREAQQKEAAKAEKERQKELHKQEKEAEKEQKKAEKEEKKAEKKAEKEAEKEQKAAEKEAEKERKESLKRAETEEKERQASLTAAEERERARAAAEEEDRKRKEREAAAGVGAAAFTGAGMTAHEKKDHDQEAEQAEKKEKKPSIFRRIFKRRKNKDTGEDEDYSTDDEEDKAAKSGSVPVHHSEDKGRNVLGAAGTSGTGAAPRDSVTGLPYDPSKDEDAARRLSREPGAVEGTSGRGLDAAPAGAGSLDPSADRMPREEMPIEKLTGLPYDPSKDEAAASRLAREDYAGIDIAKQAQEIAATGEEGQTATTSGIGHSATETSGTGQTTATTLGKDEPSTAASGTGQAATTTLAKDEPTTSGVSGDTEVKPASFAEPFGVIGDTKR